MSSTAVVTVVHHRREHLARQRASLARSSTSPVDHVVVAMDDPELAAADGCAAALPGTPLGLPLAAARNHGAAVALARGADTLVFLDVDCLAAETLVEAYADVVRDEPATIWSGPVTYLDPPPAEGYDLTALGDLDVSKSIDVVGAGPAKTVIDGAASLESRFVVSRNLPSGVKPSPVGWLPATGVAPSAVRLP